MRNLTTVPEVWQEYKYGINGNPSVEKLVAESEYCWEPSTAERSYYKMRERIYILIKRLVDGGKNVEDAVDELERLRVEQKWSLRTLQLNIPSLTTDSSTGKLQPVKTVYVLLQNLTTVYEVWQEYKYGINGNPSVEKLVQDNSVGWLKSSNERHYYYGRKKIYDYIRTAMMAGISEEDAVKKLENLRLDNKWNLRILQFKIDSVSVDKGNGHLVPVQFTYKMLRNITTVPEAWNEYKHGLNGNPAVSSIVSQYGTSWLESDNDRRFYFYRKRVYDYIINNYKPEDVVVGELENIRLQRGWSLNVLQEHIAIIPSFKNRRKLKTMDTGYRLLRNLTTVPEVWHEFKYGNPSVESIVEQNGTEWLITAADRLFYKRRKKLYDFILNAINNGKPETDAVLELEELRISQNWTLGNLQLDLSSVTTDDIGKPIPGKSFYRLLRNLKNVPEVWQEYKYGINGNPSVESLVKEYGTKWLTTSSEKRYFRFRNRIYQFILTEVDNGKSEEQAVNELEHFRNWNGWSLSYLQEKMPIEIIRTESQSLRNNESFNVTELSETGPLPMEGESEPLAEQSDGNEYSLDPFDDEDDLILSYFLS